MLDNKFTYIAALAFVLVACSDPSSGKPKAKVEDAEKAVKEKEVQAKEPAKEVPAAKDAVFALDGGNTVVGFVGAKVVGSHAGRFEKVEGKLEVPGGDPLAARLSLKVHMDSVVTDIDKFTEHLKSPDFFEVEKHPAATFESTEVKKGEGRDEYLVTGNLTLRGVAKKVTFPATATLTDGAAAMKTEFTIDRKDFGITYPGMPDNLIKDEVVLKIAVEAKR